MSLPMTDTLLLSSESHHRRARCWPLAAACGLAMLALGGCTASGPALHTVTGRVATSEGQGCDGALVVFHPLAADRVNEKKPFATCEQDGSFTLTTNELGDGAEAGDYGVTVVWIRKDEGGEQKMSLSSESSGGRDALGGRYGKPSDPQFEATVAPGDENSFEFVVTLGES